MEAFPSVAQLGQFILACAAAQVPFKATAGLHHAVPGVHPLTDAPGSPSCRMHGFLNVFLSAVFLSAGEFRGEMLTGAGFAFENDGVRWDDLKVSTADIRSTRERLAISFGSCSFEEPVSELKNMGLL